MAQRSLKPFYLALVAVAVIGGGVLFMSAQRGRAPVVMPTGALPLGADSVAPAAYQLGADTAPVVVDEWSDFECPVCSRFAILVFPDIQRRFIQTGLVRWRVNDFPLPGHTNSPTAHLAAACAARQGRFWPMKELIYYNQGEWVRQGVRSHMREYAQQAGVDVGSWDACMGEQEPLTRIAQAVERGRGLGVSGTPTFFVNGQPYRGGTLSFDDMRAAIEAAAAAARR